VKGFSSECTILELDWLWNRKCLQACVSTFHPGNFTGWGSEGVKLILFIKKENKLFVGKQRTNTALS